MRSMADPRWALSIDAERGVPAAVRDTDALLVKNIEKQRPKSWWHQDSFFWRVLHAAAFLLGGVTFITGKTPAYVYCIVSLNPHNRRPSKMASVRPTASTDTRRHAG
jgi:hypothetical protein